MTKLFKISTQFSASPRWRSEERWQEWVSNEREGRKNRWLHYFYGKLKSPRWQSEDRWEEWVSNEREGRKNHRLWCFFGKLNIWFWSFQPVQFQHMLTCSVDAADVDTGRDNLGRKKTASSECMKLI